MFKSLRVPCFLAKASTHGDDTENKELLLVFHLFAIPQDLASEISPLLADRLFRMGIEGWEPALEVSKAQFASIQIPMQNIEFHPLPDAELDGVGEVLVPGCAISNLRAQKEGTQFRLEFDVVVPMDSSTMRLVEKYYKATTFLTMNEIQRKMEYEVTVDADVAASLQEASDDIPEAPEEAEKPKKRGRRKKEETSPTEEETA